MHVRRLLPLGLILLGGCGLASDGEEGESGIVRFSLVVDYAQSADFSSPIAVNRTVFVALQHPKEGIIDDETFTELTLRVEDPANAEVESVFPLGFAQYGIVLSEVGRHRLVAVQKTGDVLDRLTIFAEQIEDIEVDDTVRVTTTFDDGRSRCTSLNEMSLANVVLHENQSIELFVVPRSRNAQPMLGLLSLVATGPGSIQLHSPLVGQGRNANALVVSPKTEMGETIDLVIEDQELGKSIELSIPATNDRKVLDCSS